MDTDTESCFSLSFAGLPYLLRVTPVGPPLWVGTLVWLSENVRSQMKPSLCHCVQKFCIAGPRWWCGPSVFAVFKHWWLCCVKWCVCGGCASRVHCLWFWVKTSGRSWQSETGTWWLDCGRRSCRRSCSARSRQCSNCLTTSSTNFTTTSKRLKSNSL